MTKTERDRDLTRRCIVEKWALLVANPEMNEPPCQLCAEYAGCVGCPIRAKTGRDVCRGTPYDLWEATSDSAQAMEDFLWAQYDDLTEKMLAERGEDKKWGVPCIICGADHASRGMHYLDDGAVCSRCARDCYKDGHYLVPVVRGGPWEYGDTCWERWKDGVLEGHQGSYARQPGYRVCKGVVQHSCCGGGFTDSVVPRTCARPGVELRAPKDYTGDLPAGCRWADGSEPKNPKHTIRKEDVAGEVFTRAKVDSWNPMTGDRVLVRNGTSLEPGTIRNLTPVLPSGGAALVFYDGAGIGLWHNIEMLTPCPKDESPFHKGDRVKLLQGWYCGEHGTVLDTGKLNSSGELEVPTRIDERNGSFVWPPEWLELVCRGEPDALELVRRLAKAVAGGDIGEAARIAREGD